MWDDPRPVDVPRIELLPDPLASSEPARESGSALAEDDGRVFRSTLVEPDRSDTDFELGRSLDGAAAPEVDASPPVIDEDARAPLARKLRKQVGASVRA